MLPLWAASSFCRNCMSGFVTARVCVGTAILIEKDTSYIVGDRMDGLFCGAANFCIANLPKAANTNI